MNLNDRDFLGNIYEYIIGRGMTTMSDDGQYFTPRDICKYTIELCNPNTKDKKIPSMIDPFCGTGGFIVEYVKYICKQKNLDINGIYKLWSKQKNRIYGNDIKVSSVMSSLLNLVFITGITFDSENMVHKNTFYDTLFENKKFDIIATNPPFGGDKDKGEDFKFKYGYYTKGMKKVDENYTTNVSKDIQSIGIKIDDKMAVAVELCMSKLKKNGTCGIVLPEGFFFGSGKALVELRKKLIEEFNVKYIVDIPQDAFENTSTKTCLMVFSNNGKTEEIEFIDWNMISTKENRTLVKVKYDEIKVKEYSFNYKRYVKQEWGVKDGYKLYKLGDILHSKNGQHITKSDIKIGPYPVVSAGIKPMGHHNNFNTQSNTILISQSGANAGYMSMYNKKVWAADCFTLHSISKSIANEKYIYYFLKNNQKKIISLNTGTAQPHFYFRYIENWKIPLPSIEKQEGIVKKIDSCMVRANQIKEIIKSHIECMKCDVVSMYQDNKCEMTRLGDVCSYKNGTHIRKNQLNEGLYPVVSAGITPMGYHDKYNRNKNTITISQSGANAGFIKLYTEKIWTADCFSIESTNREKILDLYIYYFLKNNQEKLIKLNSGTAQPHFYFKYIEDWIIPVPPLHIQKQLEPDFEKLIMLQKWQKELETKGNKLINELGNNKKLSEKEIVESNKQKIEEFKKKNDEINNKYKKIKKLHEKII